jgi:peptidoglycan/LPS O-acetylase OafA/YrhL
MVAVRDGDYLPALTGLRGVAAAWVLLFHLWQFAGAPALAVRIAHHTLDFTPLASCGFFGVDLFFALSGFLLSIPFHRASLQNVAMPNLRAFWERRCRRVLPAYYVQLAVLAALMLVRGDTAALTATNLGAHALLVQNFIHVPETFNGVYWTMPIEWDFYIVLPLLALLLARLRAWLALACVIAFAVAFRIACYQVAFDPAWGRYLDYGAVIQLPARVDEFFFGVLCAWVYVRAPAARARLWILAGATGIAVAMIAYVRLGNYISTPRLPWVLLHFTWVGAVFGAFVFGAASQRRWFCGRMLAWLGLISYSLYLWHYPLLLLAQHFDVLAIGGVAAMLRDTLIVVPAILLVSWLSQHFVERPFLAAHQRKVVDLQETTVVMS